MDGCTRWGCAGTERSITNYSASNIGYNHAHYEDSSTMVEFPSTVLQPGDTLSIPWPRTITDVLKG